MGTLKTATDAVAKSKLSKKMETFAPNLLRASREGRNTVSSERALKGQGMVASAFGGKTATSRGTAALAEKNVMGRGIVGNQIARQDRVDTSKLLNKGDNKAEAAFAIREERDKLMKGETNFGYHQLRSQRAAPVQMNGSGYSNPRLIPNVPQSGNISAPTPYRPFTAQHNFTFDNRPNRTGAAQLLDTKMNTYR
jgi:hypothetical protein